MIVLIGEISKLKPSAGEGPMRDRLRSVLARINRDGREIVSPHTLTVGREFQAVYSGLEYLFDHLWLLLFELHPVRARFSIGVGEIATDINREQAIGMDGPAFRYAREGLGRLEKNKQLFAITGEIGICANLIGHSLALISNLMKNWEKNRFAVLYGLSRERTITEIANFLEISERSVYKNIRAGSLDTILETVKEIGRLAE